MMVSRQLDDSIWEGGGQKFNRRRATKGARCTRSPARGTARFTTAKPKIGHLVQGPGGPVAQRRLAETARQARPQRDSACLNGYINASPTRKNGLHLVPPRFTLFPVPWSPPASPRRLRRRLLPKHLCRQRRTAGGTCAAWGDCRLATCVDKRQWHGRCGRRWRCRGVAGAQLSGGPEVTAFGAIGGALVGGIGGAAAEQAVADAKGWEYIVQGTGGNLVSVTQTSKVALPVGLHVLVIAGTQQARIVPDYTVQIAATSPAANAPAPVATGMKPAATNATNNAAASNGSTTTPAHVSPAPPAAGAAVPSQAASVTVASSAIAPPAASSATAPPAASSAVAPPAPKPATATPSGGSAATSVQVAPKASSSTPPEIPPLRPRPEGLRRAADKAG